MSGEPADLAPAPPPADARARLQRLAYTILSPSLGRRGRTLIAHAAVERALRTAAIPPVATYPELRERVVRRTLATGRRRALLATRGPRLRSVATTRPELATLLPAARAAYALRHFEGLDRSETHEVLAAAGVGDPATATTLAERILTDRPG